MTKNTGWMKLDNAAKIYPASKRRNWTALFRVSAELSEPVVPEVLQRALEITAARFPSMTQRLRRGFFWYYLEQIEAKPQIQHDVANPCVRMKLSENNGYMFRVRYYRNRIAVEFFHVITDGTGGMCFLKTLVAEYLTLKYGAVIPRNDEILDCSQVPAPDESEDAFFKYAKGITSSRSESSAYYYRATPERADVIHITTGIMDSAEVLGAAKAAKASLTEYLTAILIGVYDKIQRAEVQNPRRLMPVKICVPINLRKFYPTHTLRNFSNYTNPGIEPRYGEYTFEETVSAVHHHMGFEVTEKQLNAKISTNVRSESWKILRIMPLFIKNLAMRLVFNIVGDRQTTSSISNLGVVKLPPEMERYVERMDFILGPLSRNRVIGAVLSYKGKLYFNFTSTVRETDVQRGFFTRLVKNGIHVKIESNSAQD